VDDSTDVIYAHHLHSRISVSKDHLSLCIIQRNIVFRFLKRPKIRSSAAYIPLENRIERAIPLRKTFVFVTAIYKALEDIAERINTSQNLNLWVICEWWGQCIEILVTLGKELVDILSEAW
jgi:hypothetical protein